MRAISVRQPWAWLLFNGKPIENRDWYTPYRGPLAIHAAKGMTTAEYEDAVDFVRHFDAALAARIPRPGDLIRGAVIGTVNMVGCVREHSSPFFQGPWGHVYTPISLFDRPIPAKGALGLWEWSAERRLFRGAWWFANHGGGGCRRLGYKFGCCWATRHIGHRLSAIREFLRVGFPDLIEQQTRVVRSNDSEGRVYTTEIRRECPALGGLPSIYYIESF